MRPRVPEQLGRPFCAPLHGETVEAVAPDAPVLAPPPGKCIGRGFGRNGRVERRVEDGNLRCAGKRARRPVDTREGRCVVERRDGLELCDGDPRRVVDEGGLDEVRAAVDDPMTDGVHLGRANGVERLDVLDLVVLVDETKLQARGAGIDDEDCTHAIRTARSSRESRDRRPRTRAYRPVPGGACPTSPAEGAKP